MAHTFFSYETFPVWALFRGICLVQGLKSACLGFGKSPGKLPGPRTKVRECETACVDSGLGLILGEFSGSGLVMGESWFCSFSPGRLPP